MSSRWTRRPPPAPVGLLRRTLRRLAREEARAPMDPTLPDRVLAALGLDARALAAAPPGPATRGARLRFVAGLVALLLTASVRAQPRRAAGGAEGVSSAAPPARAPVSTAPSRGPEVAPGTDR